MTINKASIKAIASRVNEAASHPEEASEFLAASASKKFMDAVFKAMRYPDYLEGFKAAKLGRKTLKDNPYVTPTKIKEFNRKLWDQGFKDCTKAKEHKGLPQYFLDNKD